MKFNRMVPAGFALIVAVLIVSSCGHRQRGTEWMETASDVEILKKLVNDCGCIDVLSVMLRAPQSSIERIVAGESLPTKSFSRQVRQLADSYYSDGMTWKKFCKQYLPSSRFSKWYPAVCSSRFWLYCVIELIAFVIGLFAIDDGFGKTVLTLCLALQLLFFMGARRNISKLIKSCDYQTEDVVEISTSDSPSLSAGCSNLTYMYPLP